MPQEYKKLTEEEKCIRLLGNSNKNTIYWGIIVWC
jgi:hypothetical protein